MNPSRAQWAWSEDDSVERAATSSGGSELESAASNREEQEGASSSSSSSTSSTSTSKLFGGSSSTSRSSKGLYQTGVSVLALSGPVKMDLMVAQVRVGDYVRTGQRLRFMNSFDARTVASFLPVPTSGFLGNGEIGKVGSTTHLHGFTCAVGVLRAGKGMPLPPAAHMPAEKHS
ncbi:hypothetical protein DUNSADRAFT_17398 [Dunaliella salina]|uniref:Uncharacterized protein n=1 Tax=Dunaliella salina TaxID=3046 RepID=A0ABQ7G1U4_DUNSA|nr:hypothetical protein DUNSADRAFT_17398 [Dunaliella salina]|eukprot:KAF5828574.1 hypothetical protein DUNSADRAFT_17398 [Dunaliella salina]